jgi:DNA-binding NarL/FixJ family response regulator
MAEGRSTPPIAAQLVVGEGAVVKHGANIFAKLGRRHRRTTIAASSRYFTTCSTKVARPTRGLTVFIDER